MWIKSTSFNVWVTYFVWNFKGTLWNSTQNILPIHWTIWFLCNFEILRALRFKSSYVFLKRLPDTKFSATLQHFWVCPHIFQIIICLYYLISRNTSKLEGFQCFFFIYLFIFLMLLIAFNRLSFTRWHHLKWPTAPGKILWHFKYQKSVKEWLSIYSLFWTSKLLQAIKSMA